MATKRIPASQVEQQTLAQRIAESNLAQSRLQEIFTMFCEGHGVPGAAFVSIDGGEVVVNVPDIQPKDVAFREAPEIAEPVTA